MRTKIPGAILLAASGLLIGPFAAAQQEAAPKQEAAAKPDQAQSLDQLLKSVQEGARERSKEYQAREQRFLQARNQQQALLTEAKNQLAAAEKRSDQLKTQFDQNEEELGELTKQRDARVGNMGELFGVVRQVAGEAGGLVDSSLITAQYPERGDFLGALAETTVLPSIPDLNRLRALLFQEMVESGEVDRFPDTIVEASGDPEDVEVVRVGVFNAVTGNRFLTFDQDTHRLHELPRQPAGRYRDMAEDLFDAKSGETVSMAIDPSRGSLLALLIQAPGFLERVQQGGPVGYVIIIIGILGVLIAVERFLYLTFAGGKIKRQRNSDSPATDNALGRILGVYHENKHIDTETLELKLDEAILKETPALEKRQGIIKVFAAVAPLLGLLGTVVGMIATFQAITLFGTGDPKLMAGGISTALVTTVEGLCVAIPLVLLHSIIAGRSKNLIEILEEQSAGIIARHSEQEQHV